MEWGKYGIRLNCIAPGPIHTEGAFTRLDPTGQWAEESVKEIPAGRMGEVDELANLATFLCSDFANWISAETVTLDGGEFRSLAGEFSRLRRVPDEMWDQLAEMIRASNAKEKSKM